MKDINKTMVRLIEYLDKNKANIGTIERLEYVTVRGNEDIFMVRFSSGMVRHYGVLKSDVAIIIINRSKNGRT